MEAEEEYRRALCELTKNSRVQINMLTMLAEEAANPASIVQVIEKQIRKAPPADRLNFLYLIDSIVKSNASVPYKDLFAKNLTDTFFIVFATGDEKTRAALYKLRLNWKRYFAGEKLRELDEKIIQTDPSWPNSGRHVYMQLKQQQQQTQQQQQQQQQTQMKHNYPHPQSQPYHHIQQHSGSSHSYNPPMIQQFDPGAMVSSTGPPQGHGIYQVHHHDTYPSMDYPGGAAPQQLAPMEPILIEQQPSPPPATSGSKVAPVITLDGSPSPSDSGPEELIMSTSSTSDPCFSPTPGPAHHESFDQGYRMDSTGDYVGSTGGTMLPPSMTNAGQGFQCSTGYSTAQELGFSYQQHHQRQQQIHPQGTTTQSQLNPSPSESQYRHHHHQQQLQHNADPRRHGNKKQYHAQQQQQHRFNPAATDIEAEFARERAAIEQRKRELEQKELELLQEKMKLHVQQSSQQSRHHKPQPQKQQQQQQQSSTSMPPQVENIIRHPGMQLTKEAGSKSKSQAQKKPSINYSAANLNVAETAQIPMKPDAKKNTRGKVAAEPINKQQETKSMVRSKSEGNLGRIEKPQQQVAETSRDVNKNRLIDQDVAAPATQQQPTMDEAVEQTNTALSTIQVQKGNQETNQKRKSRRLSGKQDDVSEQKQQQPIEQSQPTDESTSTGPLSPQNSTSKALAETAPSEGITSSGAIISGLEEEMEEDDETAEAKSLSSISSNTTTQDQKQDASGNVPPEADASSRPVSRSSAVSASGGSSMRNTTAMRALPIKKRLYIADPEEDITDSAVSTPPATASSTNVAILPPSTTTFSQAGSESTTTDTSISAGLQSVAQDTVVSTMASSGHLNGATTKTESDEASKLSVATTSTKKTWSEEAAAAQEADRRYRQILPKKRGRPPAPNSAVVQVVSPSLVVVKEPTAEPPTVDKPPIVAAAAAEMEVEHSSRTGLPQGSSQLEPGKNAAMVPPVNEPVAVNTVTTKQTEDCVAVGKLDAVSTSIAGTKTSGESSIPSQVEANNKHMDDAPPSEPTPPVIADTGRAAFEMPVNQSPKAVVQPTIQVKPATWAQDAGTVGTNEQSKENMVESTEENKPAAALATAETEQAPQKASAAKHTDNDVPVTTNDVVKENLSEQPNTANNVVSTVSPPKPVEKESAERQKSLPSHSSSSSTTQGTATRMAIVVPTVSTASQSSNSRNNRFAGIRSFQRNPSAGNAGAASSHKRSGHPHRGSSMGGIRPGSIQPHRRVIPSGSAHRRRFGHPSGGDGAINPARRFSRFGASQDDSSINLMSSTSGSANPRRRGFGDPASYGMNLDAHGRSQLLPPYLPHGGVPGGHRHAATEQRHNMGVYYGGVPEDEETAADAASEDDDFSDDVYNAVDPFVDDVSANSRVSAAQRMPSGGQRRQQPNRQLLQRHPNAPPGQQRPLFYDDYYLDNPAGATTEDDLLIGEPQHQQLPHHQRRRQSPGGRWFGSPHRRGAPGNNQFAQPLEPRHRQYVGLLQRRLANGEITRSQYERLVSRVVSEPDAGFHVGAIGGGHPMLQHDNEQPPRHRSLLDPLLPPDIPGGPDSDPSFFGIPYDHPTPGAVNPTSSAVATLDVNAAGFCPPDPRPNTSGAAGNNNRPSMMAPSAGDRSSSMLRKRRGEPQFPPTAPPAKQQHGAAHNQQAAVPVTDDDDDVVVLDQHVSDASKRQLAPSKTQQPRNHWGSMQQQQHLQSSEINLPQQHQPEQPLQEIAPPQTNTISVGGTTYQVMYTEAIGDCVMSGFIVREGFPHRVYFAGSPRGVTVDNLPTVPVLLGPPTSEQRRPCIVVDGVEYSLAFGGPGRELIFDGSPLRGSFGGPPIRFAINGVEHWVGLEGPPPEVKIDPFPDMDLHRQLAANPAFAGFVAPSPVVAVVPAPQVPVVPPQAEAQTTGTSTLTDASSSIRYSGPAPSVDVTNLVRKLVGANILPKSKLTRISGSDKVNAHLNATRSSNKPRTAFISQGVEPVGHAAQASRSLKEFNMRDLRIRYKSEIKSLYPYGLQCNTCGMRYYKREQRKYSQHLDWHFRANRRHQKLNSRPWFMPADDWTNYDENCDITNGRSDKEKSKASGSGRGPGKGSSGGQEEAATESILLQPGEEQSCDVCGDSFDPFWDEDEDTWRIKNAVRGDNNKLYHPICYQDVSQQFGNEDDNTVDSGGLTRTAANLLRSMRQAKAAASNNEQSSPEEVTLIS